MLVKYKNPLESWTMVFETISHYKIVEKLGEGGMGVVYKAIDTKLERTVALKMLPDRLNKNDADRARFLREARTIAALNHPNVCGIFEIQEDADSPFIVMEYIDGPTLLEIIRSSPDNRLSIEQSVGYSIQIGQALEEAHRSGIIHRDIKSENIMVNSKNQIKVMDFGLAKFTQTSKFNHSYIIPGTLAYMAPEQIQTNQVDIRSDLYSFGVVMYEMITGNVPFKGDYEAAMMYSIINEEPKSLQEYLPDIPSEMLYILNRALEKAPEDRYQSMTDLLSELHRLERHSNKYFGQPPGVGSTSRVNNAKPSGVHEGNRKNIKQKFFVRGFTVILLVLISLLSIWTFNRYTKPKKPDINYQEMEIDYITTSGNVWEAAISSDGKYLAKVIFDGDLESIWLRQVETNSNVQITEIEKINYRGLFFSSDGNYLYYIKKDPNSQIGNLYKMPVLGGRTELIISDIPPSITFSPDESKIAYVMNANKIVVSSLDESNEQLFIDYQDNDVELSNPAWSSDGKNIAFFYIVRKPDKKISIKSVNITSKKEKTLNSTDWSQVSGLIWLSDGNGLIATASFQLFYIDYNTGEILRITNDFNTYGDISLSEDGKALVTVQWQWNSNIWIQDQNDINAVEKISSSGMQRDGCLGLTWAPDGRIIFITHKNKHYDLWDMNPDGTDRKQLEFREEFIYSPTVGDVDESYIVFTLRDTKGENIWRMDRDGSNFKQLTFGNLDDFPNLTPDGKWIIYNTRTAPDSGLIKISIDGESPESLVKGQTGNPQISPDGKLIAYHFINDGNEKRTGIISIDGGEIIRTFDQGWSSGWGPDNKHICFAENGILWMHSFDNSKPEKISNFGNEEWIPYYDWEPKGNRLAIVRSKNICDAVIIRNFLKYAE